MDNLELRLECLRLATETCGGIGDERYVLKVANDYANFVAGLTDAGAINAAGGQFQGAAAHRQVAE